MLFGEEEIVQQVESIWSSILGLATVPSSRLPEPRGADGYLTGCIQITGVWEGAVTLVCDERLVRQAAAIVFSLDGDDLTRELLHDTLGELTNIIGGNLKALLPATCYLCLPAVVEGNEYLLRVLRVKPITQVGFRCLGFLFAVSVFERCSAVAAGWPAEDLRGKYSALPQ